MSIKFTDLKDATKYLEQCLVKLPDSHYDFMKESQKIYILFFHIQQQYHAQLVESKDWKSRVDGLKGCFLEMVRKEVSRPLSVND